MEADKALPHQRKKKVNPPVEVLVAVPAVFVAPPKGCGGPSVFCGLADALYLAPPSAPPYVGVAVRAVQVGKPMVGVAVVGGA